MNPNQLCDLTDSQIRDIKTRFKRFAANWNIEPTESSLKMFLACAVDTEMCRLGIFEVHDWKAFYERVLES